MQITSPLLHRPLKLDDVETEWPLLLLAGGTLLFMSISIYLYASTL